MGRNEDSVLLSPMAATNPNSPKNADPFDLKDLKKKLLKTDTLKKNVKEHYFINVPSIQERKAEEPNLLIKNLSPRHSRSPNGSVSGSTIARLVTTQLASAELKSSLSSAQKRQPVTNNVAKVTTSPKAAANLPIQTPELKAKPYDPLTVSTLSIMNKKKGTTMSTLAYQKKIDSILKRR